MGGACRPPDSRRRGSLSGVLPPLFCRADLGRVLREGSSTGFLLCKPSSEPPAEPKGLRGPAAIFFISRDTCSDSIAKLFRACFLWGIALLSARYVAKWGIAQMCLCESKYQRGVSHHFGGVLISLRKYHAIWGIAAIVSQYRATWGH